MSKYFLICAFLLSSRLFFLKTPIEYHVQRAYDSTVTVQCKTHAGTGIIFNNNGKTYIWTCGHTFEDFKELDSTIIKDGKIIQNFKFPQIAISQPGLATSGKIIKFSSKNKEDLALIMADSYIEAPSIKFYTKGHPKVISEVFHIGTFGAWGFKDSIFSISFGRVARTSAFVQNIEYDLMLCTITQGCSGGGIYLYNGECIGLVARKFESSGCMTIPARRIIKWAKENKLTWAIDNTIQNPKEYNFPVEDIEWNVSNFNLNFIDKDLLDLLQIPYK